VRVVRVRVCVCVRRGRGRGGGISNCKRQAPPTPMSVAVHVLTAGEVGSAVGVVGGTSTAVGDTLGDTVGTVGAGVGNALGDAVWHSRRKLPVPTGDVPTGHVSTHLPSNRYLVTGRLVGEW
jgi:hypothetical protein